jgi:hypothetical protein
MTIQLHGTNGITFPDGINPLADKSLAASGYQKLAGGLILQWVTGVAQSTPTGSSTTQAVNFPIPFPNNVFKTYVTCKQNTGLSGFATEDSAAVTLSGVTCRLVNPSSGASNIIPVVFAIGN